jgi:hypothetical protein
MRALSPQLPEALLALPQTEKPQHVALEALVLEPLLELAALAP